MLGLNALSRSHCGEISALCILLTLFTDHLINIPMLNRRYLQSKRYYPVAYQLFLFGCWLPLLFSTGVIYGQEGADDATTKMVSPSILDSLQREDLLDLRIVTNFKKLIKEKKQEERLTGQLYYTDQEGQPVTWDIQVRTRGNQRKKVCFFPPIKIYFPKKELKARGFARKFNDYKLVLSCRSQDRYQDFVLREYLVYKLYNVLTDHSFRVQLARITIEDSKGKRKPLESYGFVIENQDELAARLGGEILETRILSPSIIDPESYDLMTLFQFMIGNTDWYAYLNHNLKALRVAGNDRPVIVPYDFDYCGLVATDYATPNGNYPIEDIRDRFFLGPCKEAAVYARKLAYFKSKKQELLQVLSDFSHLEVQEVEDMRQYLESFFEIIESPELTRRYILEHCDKHVKAG